MVAAKANALGDFLRARREQVQPEDVGLVGGTRRRVAGLRREELALLAGISSDYYLRLEQGRDTNPSAQVLDALARVLQLDVKATEYLHQLANPPGQRDLAGVDAVDGVDDPRLRPADVPRRPPCHVHGVEIGCARRLARPRQPVVSLTLRHRTSPGSQLPWFQTMRTRFFLVGA